MGRIAIGDAEHQLNRSFNLIGRSRECHFVLDDSQVSRQHAALKWTSDGWRVLDQESANGTFVLDARGVKTQVKSVPVLAGDRIRLGACPQLIELLDEGRPRAVVREVGGDSCLVEGPDLDGIALPDGLTAILPVGKRWQLARGEQVRWVQDGEEVRADGRSWALELPDADTRTQLATHDQHRRADVDLQLELTPLGDKVRCRVVHQGRVHDLGAKRRYRLLWVLSAAPNAWRPQREVLQELGLSPEVSAHAQRLYNYTFRVRMDFTDLVQMSARGAEALLEREPGQVRLALAPAQVLRRPPNARDERP